MESEKANTDMRIVPKLLGGVVDAMSSKSDVHRILICAAFSDEPTLVRFSTLSKDIAATIGCLNALGARIEQRENGWQVMPCADQNTLKPLLNCGESGSTLRFLLPVAAALGANACFFGEGRLPERPLGPLLGELEGHGCTLTGYKLPLCIEGRLEPGEYSLPGDISSQYITGLLLALPLLDGDSRIVLTTELQSRPYVDMTVKTLERFGVQIRTLESGYGIPGNQRFRSPGQISAEGDWSNAAFWLCAGALGGPIACRGLNTKSLQGDLKVLELLARFGADVAVRGDTVTVSEGDLKGIEVDAAAIPDLITALVVVAAAAKGTTTIINAGRLRIKESDRLSALAQYLISLGADVDEMAESLVVRGSKRLTGGCVDGQGDHRIVMSAAVASVLCNHDVTIRGAQAVQKSYPHFFEDFSKMGGETHVIEDRA